MKKLVLSAAVVALFATPAAARVITIEFKNDKGETNVISFDDATNKATGKDGSFDYTYDEASRKLCGNQPDGELCVTFGGDDGEIKVGATAPYTATNGNAGTATITELKE